MAAVSVAAAFTPGFSRWRFRAGRFSRPRLSWRQVSVWWVFWRVLPRLLWRLLRRLLRIRLLLSDRIWNHVLLLITAGCPGSIAVSRQSPESRPIAGADGGASPGPAHDQRLISASVS